MHLTIRHNKVAYVVYKHLVDTYNDIGNVISEVYINNKREIWWHLTITRNNRLSHDKPDILLWRKTD